MRRGFIICGQVRTITHDVFEGGTNTTTGEVMAPRDRWVLGIDIWSQIIRVVYPYRKRPDVAEGDAVEIPATLSTFNGNVYYKAASEEIARQLPVEGEASGARAAS